MDIPNMRLFTGELACKLYITVLSIKLSNLVKPWRFMFLLCLFSKSFFINKWVKCSSKLLSELLMAASPNVHWTPTDHIWLLSKGSSRSHRIPGIGSWNINTNKILATLISKTVNLSRLLLHSYWVHYCDTFIMILVRNFFML